MLLFAAVLVFAGCGSGSDADAGGPTDSRPDVTFDVVVEDGGVVGGPQTFKVDSGDVARLSVESDAADEIHVHGVDVTLDLEPGEVTEVTFRTGARGSYEVELHDTGALVGTLEVR